MNQVAVVGLGAGSMACLSQTGENWTFFEIDPAVVELASNPRLFSFLRDCDGNFDVQVGDGRLSLGREPDEKYGLIVLDAFSSDAIPIHLMTREAVELYAGKLRPGGMISFHISNKYLDLEPVIGNVARAAGLACHGRTDTKMQRRRALQVPVPVGGAQPFALGSGPSGPRQGVASVCHRARGASVERRLRQRGRRVQVARARPEHGRTARCAPDN